MTERPRRRAADLVARLDAYQRAHRWLGLLLAVLRKYSEDQGGYLASLLTYYGFLSVFPLMLILVTVLGFLLAGTPGLQQQLLHTALGQFPIVGEQLAGSLHPLQGSVPALVVGVLVASYGALRFAQAGQYVFNQVWAIPRRSWPDPFRAYARALLVVLGLGVALVATSALSGLTTAEHALGGVFDGQMLALSTRLVATVLAMAVNTGMFVLAFRVLTARHIPLRDLRGGAIAAGVAWQVLQEIGTYYVAREMRGINAAYGLFSIVLVLLAWIYLGAVLVVIAAEYNVVRANRLWPRALLAAFTETAERPAPTAAPTPPTPPPSGTPPRRTSASTSTPSPARASPNRNRNVPTRGSRRLRERGFVHERCQGESTGGQHAGTGRQEARRSYHPGRCSAEWFRQAPLA